MAICMGIAVDPYFIISEFPEESKIISSAREVNNYKPIWCIEKIKNSVLEFKLKNKRNPSIALMGLAFKPNIDDLRESPACFIADKVMKSIADCSIYIVEPNISNHAKFKICEINLDVLNADIIVYLVAHNEFKNLKTNNNSQVFDFCGVNKND